jgi:hypothetical protein
LFYIDPKSYDLKQKTNSGSTQQVSYRVKETYPAAVLIDNIKKRYSHGGWTILEQDLLNPSIPSSHLRGWSSYDMMKDNISYTFFTWSAQWQNERGDVILYSLRYQYPSGHAKLDELVVTASFLSKESVRKLKESLEP